MNINEDTNPLEFKHLLGQIEQRASALSDFQRDFVWDWIKDLTVLHDASDLVGTEGVL